MADLVLDDKALDDLLSRASVWLGKSMETLGCRHPIDVTSAKCRNLLKDNMVTLFNEAFHFVRFQNDRLRVMKSILSSTKTELIDSQKTVIELQDKLIQKNDENFQSVQKVVETTVKDTVQSEILTYSAVVEKSTNQNQVINSETLKEVVQSTVREEDRSRSVMVFGLPEQTGEDLVSSVSNVFEHLGVKPKMEVCRIGKTVKDKTTRPVKVTLTSRSTANQILSCARTLRKVEKYKAVFISPDRSLSERAQQRQLVAEVKKMNSDEPNRKHFLKGGKICSVDKST